ncbi:MAG TPA: DUF5330 domain-containing protein [Pseudorhodoplanes sp.]|jgi:hypothetical protein|nr:DUF5330 domain-containing protein [Pseudorhodoplanes sp.]
MFFLLRIAFWLSIVLVLLPSGTPKSTKTQTASVGAVEAVSAAGAAVSDMSQFCDRQPEACQVGAQAAAAFGQRAQAGARMVFDFINEKMAQSETGSIRTTAVAPNHPVRPSQNTLRASDLQPAWRGPAPRNVQSRPAAETRNAS